MRGRRGPRRERDFRRRRRALQKKRPRLFGDVRKLVRAAAFEVVGRGAGVELDDKIPRDVASAPGKDRSRRGDEAFASLIVLRTGNVLHGHAFPLSDCISAWRALFPRYYPREAPVRYRNSL